MVNENPANNQPGVIDKTERDSLLQSQLDNMLSGVEKSLAVTCDSIMAKMRQLEEKIQDMETRYKELTKEAEQALKEAETVDKANGTN